MIKGKVLKDADDLTKFGLKTGMTLMMMGTAEEQGLREPAQAVQFLEDMTPAERARAMNEAAAVMVSAGLENLGNTCYMNSVFQCLKRVNELKSCLKEMQAPEDQSAYDPNTLLTMAAGATMKGLEAKEDYLVPHQFIQMLRTAHPLFDEVDERSRVHKQQDADEALISVLGSFRGPLQRANPDNEDVIGNLFELELQTTHTNKEDPTEVTTVMEKQLKLTCQIENGKESANSLQDGLKLALEGDIEKDSQSLGRNAVWSKVSKVNKLVSLQQSLVASVHHALIIQLPLTKSLPILFSPNTCASTS